jgi:hypothetical protein
MITDAGVTKKLYKGFITVITKTDVAFYAGINQHFCAQNTG